MKTKLLIAVLAVVAALSAAPAWGQMAKVKGKVIDITGKPMVGAVVDIKNNESGRAYSFKADSKGEFLSIAVSPGKYSIRVTLDGKDVFRADGYVVAMGGENPLNIDLAAAQAQAQAQMSPEEKAKRENALKENKKIAGLNQMLTDTNAALAAQNFAEAVRIMTEATQLDTVGHYQIWSKYGEATVAYGRSLLSTDRTKAMEQFQLAINAYKKAIELKPADAKPEWKSIEATFHNNLAQAYSFSNQPQLAVTEYEAAATIDPQAKYYFNLGAVLTNAGKADEANAAFEKAIAADPDYAEAHYQKAVNLMGKAKVDPKTGTMSAPPEVAAGFNKYLELAPTGPNAEAAKALLASIGAKVETSFGKGRPAKKK